VVDIWFRVLDPALTTNVSTKGFALIDAAGEIHDADGAGTSGTVICVDCSIEWTFGGADGRSIVLVFVVPEDQIDKPWDLQYKRAPSLSFEVGVEPDIPYPTEIGAIEGQMPYFCNLRQLQRQHAKGLLTFERWDEGGLVLGAMSPDGSGVFDGCTGIAFGDLRFASDGAILMELGPLQGWPGLSLVERDGKVTDLVRNGRDVHGQFSPNGRHVVFTVQKLGDDNDTELHVLDRDSGSLTLLKKAESVTFKFLTDGQLLVSVSDDGDEGIFLAKADTTDLEPLELPDGASFSSVQDDGEHIIYASGNQTRRTLILAKMDGSEERELASSTGTSTPAGQLSPDGQYALLSIPKSDNRRSVEFLDLATDERETISTCRYSYLYFSSDSRWALVVGFDSSSGGGDEWQGTLSVVDTGSGEVVHNIEDVVNARFSPDGAQVAYTVRTEDEPVEIHVIETGGDTDTALGAGSLIDWAPYPSAE
jgi:dipeptidyl aminopeptidase/acylaminoacyl peptidase